jgi:hypothetical protein
MRFGMDVTICRGRPDKVREHQAGAGVFPHMVRRRGLTGALQRHQGIEVPMATREHRQIIETPTEARQAEPGPSVLALVTVSTGLAILILGVVWFVFFRT